jgi:hypothetical protein
MGVARIIGRSGSWAAGALLCASFALGSGAALACGPLLPESLLFLGSGAYLHGPRGELELELRRIGVEAPPGLRYVPQTTAEVEAALAAQALPSPAAIVAHRAAFEAWVAADPERPRQYWEDKPPPRGPPPALPEGLPEDWRRYHEAAALFRQHDVQGALVAFKAMLAAPGVPAGSPLRLWAHFMIGRADPADPQGFPAVQRAVAGGAPDPLGLGLASLGWQAQAAAAVDPAAALRTYLQLHAAGDPAGASSVRMVSHTLLAAVQAKEPGAVERLRAVAADPAAAAAVTVTLLTTWDPAVHGADWLAALAHSGGEAGAGAARVAWLAYLVGDGAAAQRWAEAAPNDPMARWILAGLALRAGDLERASALLAEVHMPEDEAWRCDWYTRGSARDGFYFNDAPLSPAREVWADRAGVQLRQGDLAGALGSAARAGHWVDFAYLAERVVDLDVLKAFVDDGSLMLLPERQRADGRWLLGRRLFRAGRAAEAAAYLPEAEAAQALAFVAARARGTVAGEVEAARLLRAHGMELSGTTLGPDWQLNGGAYSFAWGRPEDDAGPLGPTADERRRNDGSAPDPDRRYHYRYRAAELIWEASRTLPEQDPVASALLCEAGSWIALEEPDYADRFYKATVSRAWGSPLSVAADQLRWFPLGPMCSGAVAPELALAPRPPRSTGWLSGWSSVGESGCGFGGASGFLGLGLVALGRRGRRRPSGSPSK